MGDVAVLLNDAEAQRLRRDSGQQLWHERDKTTDLADKQVIAPGVDLVGVHGLELEAAAKM